MVIGKHVITTMGKSKDLFYFQLIRSGADTGFRKGWGGGGKLLSTKARRFCVLVSIIFSCFMKFGGVPKGGGGS